MERLTISVGQLYKYVGPTKYFFKVKLVSRFRALVGVIGRPVESPLDRAITILSEGSHSEKENIHLRLTQEIAGGFTLLPVFR